MFRYMWHSSQSKTLAICAVLGVGFTKKSLPFPDEIFYFNFF